MIPMERKCRSCGESFWVGCLDGKLKRCLQCRFNDLQDRYDHLENSDRITVDTFQEAQAQHVAELDALMVRVRIAEEQRAAACADAEVLRMIIREVQDAVRKYDELP